MRNETSRLFIALPVEIAPPLAAMLEELGRMGRGIRPVRANQIHLTLKFLGDVDEDRIEPIREALDASVSRFGSFSWKIQGLGAFPHLGRPRVIWAGCFPEQALCDLAGYFEEELAAVGFERERRDFRPHLTLARVRGLVPDQLGEMLEEPNDEVLAAQRADSIILFRSILDRGGAIHEPIHVARLADS